MKNTNYKYAQTIFSILEADTSLLKDVIEEVANSFAEPRTFGIREIGQLNGRVYYIASDTGNDCYMVLQPYITDGTIELHAIWSVNIETKVWEIDNIVTNEDVQMLKDIGVISVDEETQEERLTLSTCDVNYSKFEIPTAGE